MLQKQNSSSLVNTAQDSANRQLEEDLRLELEELKNVNEKLNMQLERYKDILDDEKAQMSSSSDIHSESQFDKEAYEREAQEKQQQIQN